jgi:hypothetical protein
VHDEVEDARLEMIFTGMIVARDEDVGDLDVD